MKGEKMTNLDLFIRSVIIGSGIIVGAIIGLFIMTVILGIWSFITGFIDFFRKKGKNNDRIDG